MTLLFLFLLTIQILSQEEKETIILPYAYPVGSITSDGSYLYIGMNSNELTSKIYRVCISNMTLCGEVTGLQNGNNRFIFGFIDSPENDLYFGSAYHDPSINTDLGLLLRIEKSSLSHDTEYEIYSSVPDLYPTTMSFDITRKNVYAFINNVPHTDEHVQVIDVSGPAFASDFIEYSTAPIYYWTTSLVVGNKLIGIGTEGNIGDPSVIMEANLDDLPPPVNISFTVEMAAITDVSDMVADADGNLYLALDTVPGQVIKLDPTYTIVDSVTLNVGEDNLKTIFISEDRYVWTATYTTPNPVLIRMDKEDLTDQGRLALTGAENVITSDYREIDGTPTVFLGSDVANGKVTKVYVGVCPPGTTLPLPCSPCPKGSYSEIENSNSCTLCPLGTYSEEIGSNSSSVCVECPLGTVSSTLGASSPNNCSICGVGSYANFTECLNCPSGTFLNFSGGVNISDCMDCPAGTYAKNPAQSGCTECVAGTFSTIIGATDSSVCIKCGRGTYSMTFGASNGSACIPCNDGYISNAIGADNPGVCSICLEGTYSWNRTECRDCGIGTFSNVTGRWDISQCIDCYTGTYNDGPAATECTKCLAGKYLDIRGGNDSSQCIDCPLGTYSSKIGAGYSSDCIDCPTGYVSIVPGSTTIATCTICEAGTYAAVGVCNDCGLGTYSNVSGASNYTTCVPCSSGFYADVPASTSCSSCGLGSYSITPGSQTIGDCIQCTTGTYSIGGVGASDSSVCVDCPAGTYGVSTGAHDISQCVSCLAGSYSNVEGSSNPADCLPCGDGYYSELEGAMNSSACIPCDPGYRYIFNLADCPLYNLPSCCVVCPAGTYSNQPTGYASTSCVDCDPDSYCPQGSSFEMPQFSSDLGQMFRVIDPKFDSDLSYLGYWWIKMIIVFVLVLLVFCFLIFVFMLSCCYHKNFWEVWAGLDCLFSRRHYVVDNDVAVTKRRTIFGGLCSICTVTVMIVLLFIVISIFFNDNITTTEKYENVGVREAETMGDPQPGSDSDLYTQGDYYLKVVLYGRFDATTCNPTFNYTTRFSGVTSATSTDQIVTVTGGEACEVEWNCNKCYLGDFKESVRVEFPAGTFSTSLRYEVRVPFMHTDDTYYLEGNVIADDGMIFTGDSNPTILHLNLYKSEYWKKTIFSSFLDLFDKRKGVIKYTGLSGNIRDITKGDQIKPASGSVLGNGMDVQFEYFISTQKYIREDKISYNIIMFLVMCGAIIFLVYFIMGITMRLVERIYYGIIKKQSLTVKILGKTSTVFSKTPGDEFDDMRAHEDDDDDDGESIVSMNSVGGGRLGNRILGEDLGKGRGVSKELEDSIVDWEDGMYSVEIADDGMDDEIENEKF